MILLQVTEEILHREFGKFGAISSIKIMWPRTDEEKRRNRNCGFVSFHIRSDADHAKSTMQSKELFGFGSHTFAQFSLLFFSALLFSLCQTPFSHPSYFSLL